ncbi:MAG: response regulator transcription factor [Sphingomonadaceae bacterium]|uniref:response regulator transcription factor n=1 Tax=Thermaurantiacus sp. TaxID=2820283 RepID=UPI00298EE4DF|nr:response regulator transcription factor [Thermaurantiacus sp.]MCS6986578.1 response regulator transcription factor [Sphingomonadaceae bacterium]MDW8414161.1 response regulator transcription factor [Thermaurantiacus sp.]
MRCAIVDDDREQAALVERLLARAGHHCDVFWSGPALLSRMRQETYDLVVLDWTMPGLSGLEVLKSIRQGPYGRTPVLMLTSRADDADVVTGLEAGADDYVVKPVVADVFLARVGAILRRAAMNRPPATSVRHGPYLFDRATETVHFQGVTVKLTAKEFALALVFFENLSRPLSRTWLLETVWGTTAELESRTLDAHVSKIRAKLRLRADMGYRLLPVYSYGYRLEGIEAPAPQGETVAVAGDG